MPEKFGRRSLVNSFLFCCGEAARVAVCDRRISVPAKLARAVQLLKSV
jgi:hypothetical protein